MEYIADTKSSNFHLIQKSKKFNNFKRKKFFNIFLNVFNNYDLSFNKSFIFPSELTEIIYTENFNSIFKNLYFDRNLRYHRKRIKLKDKEIFEIEEVHDDSNNKDFQIQL